MYQLVAAVIVFDNGEFFQFRACRYGNALWCGWMKQLVYENQQCPETIEELQQRVEVAAATVRGTPGVFYVSVQTC